MGARWTLPAAARLRVAAVGPGVAARAAASASRALVTSARPPCGPDCRSTCPGRGSPFRRAAPASPLSVARRRGSTGHRRLVHSCRHAASRGHKRTTDHRRTAALRAQPASLRAGGAGAAGVPRPAHRQRARPADRDRSVRGDRSRLHLLHRLDADDGEAGGDNDGDATHQSQARTGQCRLGSEDEA